MNKCLTSQQILESASLVSYLATIQHMLKPTEHFLPIVQRCYEGGEGTQCIYYWDTERKERSRSITTRTSTRSLRDTPCLEVGAQIITFGNPILIPGNNSSFAIVLEAK